MSGIGFFNDRFRDKIKGSNFDLKDIGYISGKKVESKDFYQLITNTGSGYPLKPTQSVNFVECHDNHTLWDRLQLANGIESNEIRQRRHRFATSIVLLSQGIPFLHSGQEFFRTKHGIENSYCSPDWINELNWDLREQHDDTIMYLKCLIQIRKSHGAFRFRTREEIERHLKIVDISANCHALLYENVENYGGWKNILVVFHHAEMETTISLPDNDKWDVLCDSCYVGQGNPIIRESIAEYTLEPLRTYVFVQE